MIVGHMIVGNGLEEWYQNKLFQGIELVVPEIETEMVVLQYPMAKHNTQESYKAGS